MFTKKVYCGKNIPSEILQRNCYQQRTQFFSSKLNESLFIYPVPQSTYLLREAAKKNSSTNGQAITRGGGSGGTFFLRLLICLHNALESHLKLVPGVRACFLVVHML